MRNNLDPDKWFPSFWFFLRNVAYTYPDFPNEVTKRKYYDFIQNIPLFIPHNEWSKQFSNILDSFPVTPYLANRDSFFFWIHFIQNRIARIMEKEEKTLTEYMEEYYDTFLPNAFIQTRHYYLQKKYIYLSIILFLLLVVGFLCRKRIISK
jgi:hypothetical protein